MSAEGFEDTVTAFPGVETFARQRRFRVEDFNTIRPGSFSWLVKGLWPSTGVCFLGGPSMTYKTFWALDACARVCQGRDILGRKVKPKGIAYVGSEDPAGIRLRIEGLRNEIGELPDDAFKFIGQAPDLTDEADVEDLCATLRDIREAMNASGVELGLVVIDTMSASIPGADENTAKDMSPVLKRLQQMAEDLGLVVLMVAHTGKDAERGLRGWSGLLANADGLIMLEPGSDETQIHGLVVKVKNGRSGDLFAFSRRIVTIGEDEDGDSVTTCVIDEADAPERQPRHKGPAKRNAAATLIMQAYSHVWDNSRVRIMALGADGAFGVEISALRSRAYDIGVGGSEPDYTEYETETQKKAVRRTWLDNRLKAFNRALEHLQDTKAIRVEGGFAWEARNKGGAAQ